MHGGRPGGGAVAGARPQQQLGRAGGACRAAAASPTRRACARSSRSARSRCCAPTASWSWSPSAGTPRGAHLLGGASPCRWLDGYCARGDASASSSSSGRRTWPRTCRRSLRGYGYVPVVPDSDDPEHWHSLDMLTAHVADDTGRTRALLHLDEPGRRPSPPAGAAAAVADDRAAPAGGRRDRGPRGARPATPGCTRRPARWCEPPRCGSTTASADRGGRPRLVAGFRAATWSSCTATTTLRRTVRRPRRRSGSSCALEAPPPVAPGRPAAVIVVEPDHVWGDDQLDREHRADLGRHLADRPRVSCCRSPSAPGTRPSECSWCCATSATPVDRERERGRARRWSRPRPGPAQHPLPRARARADPRAAAARRLPARADRDSLARAEEPTRSDLGHVEMLGSLEDLPPSTPPPSLRAMSRSSARLTSSSTTSCC